MQDDCFVQEGGEVVLTLLEVCCKQKLHMSRVRA